MTPKTENRKPKTVSYATPAHEQADRLLAAIRKAIQGLEREQFDAAEAMRNHQLYWGPRLEREKGRVAYLEEQLKELEKAHRSEFFGDLESARAEIPHGVLTFDLSRPVIKRKTVTPELLEQLGFPEAVRIAKSVNWDELETWPEARLILAGTERKIKETYGFELKEKKGEQP